MLRIPVAFAAAILLLAACASFDGSFHVTPFVREQITGDTRRACTAREYQFQTRIAVRAGRDWARATRFADKGRAALANEPFELADPADFHLGNRAELTAARAHLAALTQATCECGRVQALYDAWVEWSADPSFVPPVIPDMPLKQPKPAFDEGLKACEASRPPR